MRVYLIPIGATGAVKNMDKTILNEVEKQVVEKYLKINDSLYENNKISLWGVIPGKRNTKTWSNFMSNDIVIFVPSKSSLIATEILATDQSKGLARELWGTNKDGKTWELIFFVRIIGRIKKDKRPFLTELGYPETDNLEANREITSKLNDKYQSIGDFLDQNLESYISYVSVSSDIDEEAIETVIPDNLSKAERLEHLKELANKALEDTSRKYITVDGRKIMRKSILVKLVKERDDNKCQSCGFTFKKKNGENYVEVAHMRGLAEGGPDHPDNMVALCPNCHKKLDMGDEDARNNVITNLRNNGFDLSVSKKGEPGKIEGKSK